MNLSIPVAYHPHPGLAPVSSVPGVIERLAAVAGMILLCAIMASSWIGEDAAAGPSSIPERPAASPWSAADHETVASVYAGAPYYHRSDLHLNRPDGTDMTLKRLGWDGDAFYFPIDGGARVIRWTNSFGVMVDFLHNKAITRLGKGTHGRKIKDGVIEDVETEGTLGGKPAPSPLHLTDLLDRLEFTHGYNTLMLTGLARLPPLTRTVRPYFGIGFGVAIPHVEVRFAGEPGEKWTNEYQLAGPGMQLLAGLELRIGRGSYYVEYKFIWSSISAALTNGKSWSLKDLRSEWLPRWLIEPFSGLSEMPGDLFRQFRRWKDGETPSDGRFTTHLASHELVFGAGYAWPRGVPTGAGPTPP